MSLATGSIGDISTQIRAGKTPPTKTPEYFDGTYNWYTPGDFSETLFLDSSARFISEKAIAEKKATIFEKDTVLISCIGDIGKIGVLQRDSSCNQQITGISLKPHIDPLFFAYWCKANKNIFQNRARNAVVPILNNTVLSSILVTFPEELDDQKRIASLLGKVEGLIARRKQHLQQLDDLLKSVFLEMFGDPVRNEKGWEKKTAIDYSTCIVPGRDKPKSFTGNIPWVTTNDMVNLGFTNGSQQQIGLTTEEIEVVRARVIPKGSVILTCVGDLGVVSICENDMVVNQQLHSFQVSVNMNNIFFMFCLSFQKAFMYRNASKTTVPYMNKTICNRIPMIAPPYDLQNQFAAIVEMVDTLKSRYQKSLTDLENLYGALSQKAFKGELDLSRVVLPVASTTEVTDGTETHQEIKPFSKGFARQLLAAEILQRHNSHDMTQMKLQKLIHLTEYHARLDEIQGEYQRQAAGPFDNRMVFGIAHGLKKQQWFEIDEPLHQNAIYVPLAKAGGHAKYLPYWQDKMAKIDEVLGLLGRATPAQCEIASTLYAAWNDLLIDGVEVTDERIIEQASKAELWHKTKEAIDPERWPKALQWMRDLDLVPTGYGKHTRKLQ